MAPNARIILLCGALAGAVGFYFWFRSRAAADGSSSDSSDPLNAISDVVAVAVSRVTNAATSRGYRNNNPGNIRYLSSNAWNGQVGNDNGYGVYDTPQNGTRALGHQLRAYGDRGLDTVGDIISTWAPSSDGNNTSAYVSDVASQLSVDPADQIDIEASLADLAAAIARHENGYLDSSYDWQWVYLS